MRLDRRSALKAVFVAGAGAAWPGLLFARSSAQPKWPTPLTEYLASLARPDGGYAWADQPESHLTPTFAVIGCYRLLRQTPPNKAALAEFIRTHHPSRLKRLEQPHHEFAYQQIQGLVWLGEDASSFAQQVLSWKKPETYLKQYERHGYPVLRHQVVAITCRALLGLPLDDIAEYRAYLEARRRPDGSFNNTPTVDGGDGNVLNTWYALEALEILSQRHSSSPSVEESSGRALENNSADWLRVCQLATGGFTHQPAPEFSGVADVIYTWAGVRALQQQGAEPARRQSCIDYLLGLTNADGGFGPRRGWPSNPVATYCALDSLYALGAFDLHRAHRPRPLKPPTRLPDRLKVFSVQLEAHGQGSPVEAVELARALRIHLWGAKNAEPGWLQCAQAIADRQHVPVKFFVANEEYGTWVNVPGLGTYSHTSDIMVPAGSDFGRPVAGKTALSWPEYRERRLEPLRRAKGALIWQFGENEPLVRLYLDDSLQRGGYAAISTFHFGNPDFTNSEPFLQHYRGQLPFVALQDAHGEEPWWFSDMTEGFRTVFLGTRPTWEEWLQALERNWVAAVRHDEVSGGKTWIHAGRPEVEVFIRQSETQWRWWNNPAIQRPLVSLVAIGPQDRLEKGCPEQGIALRVRCAWTNTSDGRLKSPLAEFVSLMLDGEAVQPEKVANAKDHFCRYEVGKPRLGKHSATVVVQSLETKQNISRTIEFETSP